MVNSRNRTRLSIGGRGEDGFALITALMVFLLFVLAAAFVLARLQRDIRSVERQKMRIRALDMAESGLAYAARQVVEEGDELSDLTLSYPGAEISIVAVEDPPGAWRITSRAQLQSVLIGTQTCVVEARGRSNGGKFYVQNWSARRGTAAPAVP